MACALLFSCAKRKHFVLHLDSFGVPSMAFEGQKSASSKTGFWKKTWLVAMVLQARLRFFFILALIGAVALSWNSITARWEKWMRPTAAVHSDTEYYCPMHLQIIREKPGEKCPICGMPLSERKKG